MISLLIIAAVGTFFTLAPCIYYGCGKFSKLYHDLLQHHWIDPSAVNHDGKFWYGKCKICGKELVDDDLEELYYR